jgi:hypothetical protein
VYAYGIVGRDSRSCWLVAYCGYCDRSMFCMEFVRFDVSCELLVFNKLEGLGGCG